ncbi:MAG: tetratricopeptide repeat protein [Qingshengfaniella sp.]
MVNHIESEMRQARSLERKGSTAAAIDHYKSILRTYPKNRRAQTALSRLVRPIDVTSLEELQNLASLRRQGRMLDVFRLAEEQIEHHPDSEVVLNFLGVSALSLGRLDKAKYAFFRIVSLFPEKAGAHANLGNTLHQYGDLDGAETSLSTALHLSPGNPEYHLFRGSVRVDAENFSGAISDFEVSLKSNPENKMALEGLVRLYHRLGSLGAAGKIANKIISIDPTNEIALNCLASAVENGQGSSVNSLHYIEDALKDDPKNESLLIGLSVVQLSSGDVIGSIESAKKCIQVNPKNKSGFITLAKALEASGEVNLTIRCYQQALNIDPEARDVETQMFHLRAKICDWTVEKDFQKVAGNIGVEGKCVAPWALLSFEDFPERQLVRSQHYAEQWAVVRPEFDRSEVQGKKIKIGYISSDLHDHATLFLLAGVLECHNKDDFDVFVYGLNAAPEDSTVFERMKAAVDQYVDLHNVSDEEIVDRVRRDDIDIAIDLKGYTRGSRPGIFFPGLAPVQINYLGYPGSLGSDAFDYMIADDVVVPHGSEKYYTESILRLPYSYQPNDDAREISDTPVSRSDFMLPEDAIVFCCFNNLYKVSSQVFDIWMRVMREVEHSVLWLLDMNDSAPANLRREAEARGVDSGRLIFSKVLPQAEHVARYRLADLFLDTFNVNAHTTASDSLYAGVPMVTRPGLQFAARVGASLCHAVGLDDLIAKDNQEYEEIILNLAKNPDRLREVRDRLKKNIVSSPLFDTKSYTAYLEDGYRTVFKKWRDGEAPSDVWVTVRD